MGRRQERRHMEHRVRAKLEGLIRFLEYEDKYLATRMRVQARDEEGQEAWFLAKSNYVRYQCFLG